MAYSAVRADGVAVYPASAASQVDRLNFIKKVYALTFTGVLAFAVSAALPVLGLFKDIPGLRELGHLAVGIPRILCFFALLGVSMLARSTSMMKGINLVTFYLLAATLGFFAVGLIGASLVIGGAALILQALGLTTLVFGGLSAYVLLSRKDFSFMRGFLAVGTMLVLGTMLAMFVAEFFGVQFDLLYTALSAVVVLLMSLYVLYDTSSLFHRYSVDMVVPAATALMVDFVILFQHILSLLARARN